MGVGGGGWRGGGRRWRVEGGGRRWRVVEAEVEVEGWV